MLFIMRIKRFATFSSFSCCCCTHVCFSVCVCVLLCECVVVLLRLLRITRICKYTFMREVANLSILQLFDLSYISNYLLHTHQDHFQKWRPFVHTLKKYTTYVYLQNALIYPKTNLS